MQVLGNVKSYSESLDWALQVIDWDWNGNSFTPDAEAVSDIAVLSSAVPYIAVPDILYVDMWSEFESLGWTCYYNYSPNQENYCYVSDSCANYINLLPVFQIQFENYASYNIERFWTVNLYPEVYLEQLAMN